MVCRFEFERNIFQKVKTLKTFNEGLLINIKWSRIKYMNSGKLFTQISSGIDLTECDILFGVEVLKHPGV